MWGLRGIHGLGFRLSGPGDPSPGVHFTLFFGVLLPTIKPKVYTFWAGIRGFRVFA